MFCCLGLLCVRLVSAGGLGLVESDRLRNGPMSELAFLVGDYRVQETRYRSDGNVAETSVGGKVSVRPALDGSYLALAAAQAGEAESEEVLLWLITWDSDRGQYVGRVFSGEDSDSGEASGDVGDNRLELITAPIELPDGKQLRVRFTARLRKDGGVDILIHQSTGDGWALRAEERWDRADPR